MTTKSPSVAQCAAQLLEGAPPIIWFVRRQMRAHRSGLSLPQFRTLVRIDHEPSASLSSVAEHLGSSLPTTSRIVTGLVEKRLLVRTGARHDRRQMELALTARGRAVLRAARQAAQQSLQAELQVLSVGQRATLIQAMMIVKTVFGSFAPLETSSREAV